MAGLGKFSLESFTYPCKASSASPVRPESGGGRDVQRGPAMSLNVCIAEGDKGRRATGTTMTLFEVAGCSSPPYAIARTDTHSSSEGGTNGSLHS